MWLKADAAIAECKCKHQTSDPLEIQLKKHVGIQKVHLVRGGICWHRVEMLRVEAHVREYGRNILKLRSNPEFTGTRKFKTFNLRIPYASRYNVL